MNLEKRKAVVPREPCIAGCNTQLVNNLQTSAMGSVLWVLYFISAPVTGQIQPCEFFLKLGNAVIENPVMSVVHCFCLQEMYTVSYFPEKRKNQTTGGRSAAYGAPKVSSWSVLLEK